MYLRTGINLSKEINRLSKLSKIPGYAYKTVCVDESQNDNQKHNSHKSSISSFNDYNVDLKQVAFTVIGLATTAALIGLINTAAKNKKRGIFCNLF